MWRPPQAGAPAAAQMLAVQYRMHPFIRQFPSQVRVTTTCLFPVYVYIYTYIHICGIYVYMPLPVGASCCVCSDTRLAFQLGLPCGPEMRT